MFLECETGAKAILMIKACDNFSYKACEKRFQNVRIICYCCY
jgi:hypothetical protein